MILLRWVAKLSLTVVAAVLCSPLLAQTWDPVDRCVDYAVLGGHIHIVRAKLACSELHLLTTPEVEKGITTSEFAKKGQTTVAINGDFFNPGFVPRGLNITDGKLWNGASDTKDRSFLACSAGNQCQIDTFNNKASVQAEWQIAIGGWESYVDGTFACHDKSNSSCTTDNGAKTHPRTAIGLDATHKQLFLIVVEGRLLDYPGVTLEQLADVFRKLGIAEGMNLDGGSSSTLVIHGRRVNALPANHPTERKVANHLGIRID